MGQGGTGERTGKRNDGKAFRRKDFGGLGRTRGDHGTSVFQPALETVSLSRDTLRATAKSTRPIFNSSLHDDVAPQHR